MVTPFKGGRNGLYPINYVFIRLILFTLLFFLESKGSHHSARTVMYAIDWAHKVAGLEPPSNHPLVKSIVDAGDRVYGKPVVKKEPITPNYCYVWQWRGGSEAAGEAARLMASPQVILLLPFGLGRVSCRRHNMQ